MTTNYDPPGAMSGYYAQAEREADKRNAAMRGDYTAMPTLEQIHRRLNAENIDLRGQLEMARKATSAAQELLEAERQKVVKFEAEREYLLTDNREVTSAKYRLMSALDTEKLLRVNDARTIADLQRQLKEAEGQLKAQRDRMGTAHDSNIEWYRQRRTELAAENAGLRETVESQEATIRQLRAQIETMPIPYNVRECREENIELRRTISLMAKTAAEVQDNFRLIAELAADPADEKRKENTK